MTNSKVILGSGDHLEGDELEAALFEALDDIADESTLDGVGLDGDEGAFFLGGGHGVCFRWAERGARAILDRDDG